jgi:hypothetical protein
MVANGFEGVPWFVGGGATHSAEIARLAVFLGGTGSNEGVATPTDLKVTATTGTADNKVHISLGAAAIRNRSANALSQTYITREIDISDVTIAATGGAARSDLICVSIEDPQYPPFSSSGWTTSQIQNGPYVFPRVISGVPSTALSVADAGALYVNRSMYALARVTLPAGTSTVTDARIVDLRKLARPHSDNDLQSVGGLAGIVGGVLDQTAYENWPNWQPNFFIPEWCTYISTLTTLEGIQVFNQHTQGDIKANIEVIGQAPFQTSLQHGFDFDPTTAATDAGQRANFIITCSGFVPTTARGKTARLRLEGRRYPTAPGVLDAGLIHASMSADMRFYERAL